MKNLTAERLRELVHYNPESGIFTRTADAHGGRWKAGEIIGSHHSGGYLECRIDGVNTLLHRLAWLYMTGEWPQDRIDHKNGDKTDNRWCNLRAANASLNGANRGVSAASKSGVKGVSLCKQSGLWASFIMVRGKRYRLGRFASIEAAAAAYRVAAEKHFGEFART